MCPRSPEKSGAPRAARRAMARSVSAIGIPRAMIGTRSATDDEDRWFAWIAVVARTNPMNIDPVSPMKMVAGWKLWNRNPSSAPASVPVKSSIIGSAWTNARRAVVITAIRPMPPASPSRPSMRFIAFTTPAIQSIVNGAPRMPSSMGGPKGFAISSIR